MKWPIVILSCLTLNGFLCTAQTRDSINIRDTVVAGDTLRVSEVVTTRDSVQSDTAVVSQSVTKQDTVRTHAVETGSTAAKNEIANSQDPDVTNMLAHGKVMDARTSKGIKALIHYSSIPTGSISGHFNDSTFSFEIFGTAKYQITAEAKGYNPRTIIVDPKDIAQNQRLMRDIRLMPAGETIRLEHLIFPQGKSTIGRGSFQELDEIAMMMKENERIVIQLEGHTDNVGNAKANLKLSEQRVDAVKKYLIKSGISKNRVKVKSFGGAKPLRNEMTPEDRAMNRRVEMRILED
jgi:OmpA-OmpF porin, OOP family